MTSLDIRPGQLWMTNDSKRHIYLVLGIKSESAERGTLWNCFDVTGPQFGRGATFWFSCSDNWTRVA